MSDALGPAEPGDQPDRTDSPAHPAIAPRQPAPRRGPAGVRRACDRARPARRGDLPGRPAHAREPDSPDPAVPTTVWTLPTPDDTVSTASTHGTDRAAHVGLPHGSTGS